MATNRTNGSNGSNGSNDDDRRNGWLDRAKDNMRGWFRNRDADPAEDEQHHRRYAEARRRYEQERRRYDDAHDQFVNRFAPPSRDRSWVGGDEPPADSRRRGFHPEQDRYYADSRHRDEYQEPDRRDRYADTNDNSRNAWRSWSGRSFVDDREHRDRYGHPEDHPLSREDRPRVRASYDERHGHPSVRAELDYDQQWASRTERTDDNNASRMRGRDEDQDRDFVPRDEYGRRRR